MAETTVENQVCSACGADVRKDALFCYYCGNAVTSEIPVAKNDKNVTVGNTQFQENVFTENENGAESGQKEIKPKREPGETVVEKTAAKPIVESSLNEETKLKSAAAMRQKSKSIQPKRVEVIWEEHENTPNVWFIAVTIFLTILAAVILFLAMRLR